MPKGWWPGRERGLPERWPSKAGGVAGVRAQVVQVVPVVIGAMVPAFVERRLPGIFPGPDPAPWA